MSELLGWCLAIEREMAGEPCLKCMPEGLPFYHNGKYRCHLPRCPDCDEGKLQPPISPEGHSPLLIQLGDWLEERDHRDPRVQMLREMRLIKPGDYWQVHPWDGDKEYTPQADAARELCRQAFELMTMPCPCGCHDGWPSGQDPSKCERCLASGWVPAWTRECMRCDEHGYATTEHKGTQIPICHCPDCHGQRWVKVPERSLEAKHV